MVCDQNSTNRSVYSKLGVTYDHPYFVHITETVYCLFDPPHLLKSSRNNLMHHNAVYGGAVIKWDHIKSLYYEDCERIPRAAPKLTNKHIFLPAFEEMRVGVAAETLSITVSSAIKMYVAYGCLPEECLSTAAYVEDIDKLFDIFNATDNVRKSNKTVPDLEPNRNETKQTAP
ncbi:uncharacterized protein LOC129728982 [Wyeomyia smithii]|uniref:uncharacterized protein LOC129728982 n=1 Tax=Wyeomyia smithii TaxID=174621 RepID=UPI002467DC16|nr:uncharacterized protein LOC129728982 [Wyeomyia smithii]